MKKSTIAISSFLAGALLMTGISGVAASTLEKVNAYINHGITINVNGKQAELTNPIITYNNSTYVPVREIGGLVGSDIQWNGESKSVEIKSDDGNIHQIDTGAKQLKLNETGINDGISVNIHKIEYGISEFNEYSVKIYADVKNISNLSELSSAGRLQFSFSDKEYESTFNRQGYGGDIAGRKTINQGESVSGHFYFPILEGQKITEIRYYSSINNSLSSIPLFIWVL